jgi:hypothetical protein
MEIDNEPACERCVYAVRVSGYGLECRLKPPSPNYKNYSRMFPMMRDQDWCSKYKAKSESVAKPESELNETAKQTIFNWSEDE